MADGSMGKEISLRKIGEQADPLDGLAPEFEARLGRYLLPLHIKLIEFVGVEQNTSALDVGCRTGFVTLLLAPLLVPHGFAIGIDRSRAMLDVAQERATLKGNENAEFMRRGPENLGRLPNDEFHTVLCALGLLDLADPEQAVREMYRVTRPGGRVGVSAWGPAESNALAEILFDPLLKRLPNEPSPLRLGERKQLAQMLEPAGYERLKTTKNDGIWKFPTGDHFWRFAEALNTSGCLLSLLSDEDRDAVRAEFEEGLASYEGEAGFEVPYRTLFGVAHKAGDRYDERYEGWKRRLV